MSNVDRFSIMANRQMHRVHFVERRDALRYETEVEGEINIFYGL